MTAHIHAKAKDKAVRHSQCDKIRLDRFFLAVKFFRGDSGIARLRTQLLEALDDSGQRHAFVKNVIKHDHDPVLHRCPWRRPPGQRAA